MLEKLMELNAPSNEFIKLVTLGGNTTIVSALLFTIIYLYYKVLVQKEDTTFILGLILLLSGVAIRIGYWIPTIFMSNLHEPFNQNLLDYSWFWVGITTIIIVTGAALLIQQEFNFSNKFKYTFMVVVFGIGTIITIIRGILA